MSTKPSLVIDEKAKTITIVLPLGEKESKSGKSLVLATTNGNVPFPAEYKGKPVICGVNCYIPK